MKRSEYGPEWSDPHLLSFVTDSSGDYVAVHADLAGITMLIDELEWLRENCQKATVRTLTCFLQLPAETN
jgi:hypothetical protein